MNKTKKKPTAFLMVMPSAFLILALLSSCNNEATQAEKLPDTASGHAVDPTTAYEGKQRQSSLHNTVATDTNTKKAVVRLKSASIRVKCDGGGEGIDHNSKVEFQVQHPKYIMVTEFTINREVADDAIFEDPMRVADNRISKDELDNTVLVATITAVGKDGHTGTPSVTFVFDDGTIITKKYKKYVIGTFKRSHTTTQPVVP